MVGIAVYEVTKIVQVDSRGKAYRKDDVWALSAVRPKLILSDTMEGTCFVVSSSQFKL